MSGRYGSVARLDEVVDRINPIPSDPRAGVFTPDVTTAPR